MNQAIRVTVLLLALLMMTACATAGPRSLAIARQGSFAVGGTIVTSPGVFDATAQAPAGGHRPRRARHSTVITRTSSTRSPRTPVVCRWSCGTASVSSRRPGKPHLMVVRAIRRSSCGADSASMSSTSLVVAGRDGARSTRRYLRHPTNRTGSPRFGSASGPTSSRACSSRAIRRPSTSTSARWPRTSAPSIRT